jgi:hypothetical protein
VLLKCGKKKKDSITILKKMEAKIG